METDIQEWIKAEIGLAAENSIIINHEYLHDEQLTRERQFEVLESGAGLTASEVGGGLSVSSDKGDE